MREPTIVVSGSYFVKKSDWAISATGSNQIAAELISVFLFHYDNRTANRILVELTERAIIRHHRYLRELGDWLPYSHSYIRELLLYPYGNKQVAEALKLLVDIGFISNECPEDIKRFYSQSHSWFKLEIPAIRKWIKDVWFPALRKPNVYAPQNAEVRTAIETITNTAEVENAAKTENQINVVAENEEAYASQTPETLTKQVNALCNFHRHIHAKDGKTVYDAERKTRVRNRIKSLTEAGIGEAQTIAMCSQAIIGNLFSDFHQGKHPDNMAGVLNEQTGHRGKVYDDIGEYIFKTAKKFEAMIGSAEHGGVTSDIALKEFQGFISGKPSRYVKGGGKSEEKAVSGKAADTSGYDAETVKRYKNFARDVAAFFMTHVPNKEILELCSTNAALVNSGNGLTDAKFLKDKILDAARTFGGGSVSQAIENSMEQFAVSFCEIQDLN